MTDAVRSRKGVLKSTDGQPLGKRAMRTRQRILEVIAGLIEKQGLRGLKLADVAEEVGFSPPAFYQYFRDLDEAILALCQEVGEQLPAFSFPDDDWTDGEAAGRGSRPFVESFLEYWDRYRAVLWSRNVAVYEGDPRYRVIRDEAFRPMLDALMAKIEAAQRKGLVDPSVAPRSLAATLIVLLDRIGMLSPHMIEPFGDRAADLVDAVAYVFDRVLGIGGARRARGGARRSARRKRIAKPT